MYIHMSIRTYLVYEYIPYARKFSRYVIFAKGEVMRNSRFYFCEWQFFRIGGFFIFAKSEHQCLVNLGRSSFDTSILQDF